MFQLGKRPWGPFAGLLTALVTVAVVLAIPGSAGAASRATAGVDHSAAASAATGLDPSQVSMTNRVVGTTSQGDHVRGTYKPARFHVTKAGDLVARGTLHLVIRSADGVVRGTFHRVQIPVSTVNDQSVSTPTSANRSGASPSAAAPAAAGSCPVLNLVLGPLDLNLLGLVVHLDRVVLNIVAQSGAGNLLGNLLCAVAGLLDGSQLGGLLGQLSNLLNSILGILRL
jgi:hypothetical protein